MNRCEAEIDAIRDEIYEETKHMTREEQAKWYMDKAKRVAEEFGFTIVASAKGAERNHKP